MAEKKMIIDGIECPFTNERNVLLKRAGQQQFTVDQQGKQEPYCNPEEPHGRMRKPAAGKALPSAGRLVILLCGRLHCRMQ